MSLAMAEVSALTGIPESSLDPAVQARLPESTPGAPWRVRMSALLWMHRARPEAGSALPPELTRRRGPGVTSAGFIRYTDTPVGPYSEVMAAPVTISGGPMGRVHIPFIAVDSIASVHGGRAHWALPKTLASFTWTSATDVRVDGDDWWLAARVVRKGSPVPLLGRSTCVQVRPDGRLGTAKVGMRGRGRLVSVEVDVDPGASYAGWLPGGRHVGVHVTSATLTMGPATWQAPG